MDALGAKVYFAFLSIADDGMATRGKLHVLTQTLESVFAMPLLMEFQIEYPQSASLIRQDSGVLPGSTTLYTFAQYFAFLEKAVQSYFISSCDKNNDNQVFDENAASNDSNLSTTVTKRNAIVKKGSLTTDAPPVLMAQFDWSSLDDVCWTLYENKYFTTQFSAMFNRKVIRFLWQLFCTYADNDLGTHKIKIPVLFDAEELDYWMRYAFGSILMLDYKGMVSEREIRGTGYYVDDEKFNFQQFVEVWCKTRLTFNIADNEFNIAMKELIDETINGVIRKGFLIHVSSRKIIKSNKYYVLTTTTLKHFKTVEENSKSEKSINIKDIASVHALFDLPTNSLTRFRIMTQNKSFTFETTDVRSRNAWISDLKAAQQYQNQNISNPILLKSLERRNVIFKERLESKIKAQQKSQQQTNLQNELQSMQSKYNNLTLQMLDMNKKLIKADEEKMKQVNTIDKENKALLLAVEEKDRRLAQEQLLMKTLTSRLSVVNRSLEAEHDKRQQLDSENKALLEALEEEKKRCQNFEKAQAELNKLLAETAKIQESMKMAKLEMSKLAASESASKANYEKKLKEMQDQIHQLNLQTNESKDAVKKQDLKLKEQRDFIQRLETGKSHRGMYSEQPMLPSKPKKG